MQRSYQSFRLTSHRIEDLIPDEEVGDKLTTVEKYRDSITRIVFRPESHLAAACPLTTIDAVEAISSPQERVQV